MKITLILILVLLCLPAQATTIAYDGKTVCADSQVTTGHQKRLGKEKLHKIDEWVVAGAGSCDDITEFVIWFFDPSKPKPKLKNFVGMAVSRDQVLIFDVKLNVKQVHAPCAIGSGSSWAKTDMEQGFNSRHAVEYAESIDLYSGGPISEMKP